MSDKICYQEEKGPIARRSASSWRSRATAAADMTFAPGSWVFTDGTRAHLRPVRGNIAPTCTVSAPDPTTDWVEGDED